MFKEARIGILVPSSLCILFVAVINIAVLQLLGSWYLLSQFQSSLLRNPTRKSPLVSFREQFLSENPIQAVLQKAGIPITPKLLLKIPPYSHVQQMYGEQPVILGLETCQNFQTHVLPRDRFLGPAG